MSIPGRTGLKADWNENNGGEIKMENKIKTPFQQDGLNLVGTIVRALVDMPEKVEINVNQGEQTTVFEIKVDKSDLGKVIGKQGKTARSIRQIVHGFSAKAKMRAVVEIIE